MLDYAVTNAQVIDGTGAPARHADVGVANGVIVAVGELSDEATETLDAEGMVLAPGFIDPHTHYDAQLHWDPLATPSSWHGVTTVIGGNCGFTLAPIKDRDADFTRRMMAQVEGMPLAALETGVPWTWEHFGEFLDCFEGSLAVNAGFLVGHCALRRYVMGEDNNREATPAELSDIAALLNRSLAEGGLGFSTSRSSTHVDADGVAVPSRWASAEEVLELCRITGDHDGTSLEAISEGCLGRFSEEEVELLATMSSVARRPLNWNVLGVSAADRSKVAHQLQPSKRARELGGRVVALTMPIFADNNMSFLTFCAMWLLPGWRDVLSKPVPERIELLKDPAVRAKLLTDAQPSPLSQFCDFDQYVIGDVYCPENEVHEGRRVGDIAAEQGRDAFSVIVDIVAADDLRTVLWPLPAADEDEDWEVRRELWEETDVLIGGSDAGAHLDRMLGSNYPTRFLGDSIRGRKLVSVERAVQLMTSIPADLFGLRDRGRIEVGNRADLVVFDPDTVGATPARIAFDLPGDSKRLLADPVGVVRVLVNGVETIAEGVPTGNMPGSVLRSGRDTTGTETLQAS